MLLQNEIYKLKASNRLQVCSPMPTNEAKKK